MYKKINEKPEVVFHYTKRENVESIKKDGFIKASKIDWDCCWFSKSLEDTLNLMEQTIMIEGNSYINLLGLPAQYPKFIPDDYVILKLIPTSNEQHEWLRWIPKQVQGNDGDHYNFTIAHRGNLKFIEAEVIEVSEVVDRSRIKNLTRQQRRQFERQSAKNKQMDNMLKDLMSELFAAM